MGAVKNTKPNFLMLAAFDSTKSLLHAAQKVRDAGYKKWDCHSPFPVHGLDDAMGLNRSPVGYIVGACGTAGLLFTLWLTWWTSTVDYPLIISGKPLFSWQAYIPVIFAITILMSAFGAFFGMLHFNRLPQLHHKIFESDAFASFSNAGFFISIESADDKFDENKTRELLQSIGGKGVEVVGKS